MGRDKALVVIDGSPMALRVARALRAAGADPVVAVGGDEASLRSMGLEFLPDVAPGLGPVAGVVAALGALPGPVFVAGCDLVDPSPGAIRSTVDALGSAGAADVALPVVDGRRQWMHAAWHATALPTLAAAISAAELAVHRAVAGLRVVEVRGIPTERVRDADTAADLAALGVRDSVHAVHVPEIDIDELALLHRSELPLIDVRQHEEYTEAHVPGARHIPLAEVPHRSGELPAEGPVYVICASGGRSARAVEHYRSLGVDAVNVAGGTRAWIEAGLPTATGPDA
jgi:rhodanese-related sulfurtransferase/molybdopterin-guanine dinucleotide biosynthesis protein A